MLSKLKVLGVGLVAAALATAGARADVPRDPPRLEPAGTLAFGAPPSGLRSGSLSRAGIRSLAAAGWWGGAYKIAGGESVTIYVSVAYPVDQSVAQGWADFFGSLAHGAELSALVAYFAPLDDVHSLCDGEDALGCYGGGKLVVVGDSAGGIPPAFVATHEYGHHVAANRSNAPWSALDWGPKRWATAAHVCQRAGAGTAFPGDEGLHYMLNPGEAWAETYRIFSERRVGATSFEWPIVDPSFFPDAGALKSVEGDVLDPWSAPRTTVVRSAFRPRGARVQTFSLAPALDGVLAIELRMPSGGGYDVVLGSADGRTRVTGLWSGSGVKSLQTTVCGTRSFFVRVTRRGAAGRFTLTATSP